jgi:hypothetical protein
MVSAARSDQLEPSPAAKSNAVATAAMSAAPIIFFAGCDLGVVWRGARVNRTRCRGVLLIRIGFLR